MRISSIDKWKTYFITFFAYAALHSMRMTYSEIKPNLQLAFAHSDLFLGGLDATVYISLGFGFFFRFLIQGDRCIISTYVLFIVVASVGYIVIPLTSLLVGEDIQSHNLFKFVLPGLGLLLFGFCQFGAWPTLLSLNSSRFNIKKQGKAMGIWAANGDFGDIIGFGLTGLLVDSLGYKWEISMLTEGGFNIVMALMVFLFVSVKPKSPELQDQIRGDLIPAENEQSAKQNKVQGQAVCPKKSKFKKFLQFSCSFVKVRSNQLYLLAFALIKCILYGFLLWIPTYLNNVGLKDYKSTIPITFNVGTLVGSFILGHFYEDSAHSGRSAFKLHLQKYSLLYCCILLSGTFTVFYLITPQVLAYFILSGISGALLGGCFNMFTSNEVIALTGGHSEDLEMLATLSMAVGNTAVGIVELLIGVTMNVKADAEESKKLFLILIAVAVLNVLVLLWRTKSTKLQKLSMSSELRLSVKE